MDCEGAIFVLQANIKLTSDTGVMYAYEETISCSCEFGYGPDGLWRTGNGR